MIFLPVTYVRHAWQTAKDWQSVGLSKYIQRMVRLLRQKDWWDTAKVNDTFKLLPRQFSCWQL